MDILPEEQDKYLATKGDLLMCEGGASGRTAIWNEDYDISFQNHVHRIRPKDLKEISPKYLLYYFEWFIKNGFASDLIKGVTISSLSQSGLRSIEVTYPPIDEQHKIVELLEDHLSRLDAALVDIKQAKLKAAQFRRSILQAAFIGYFSDESFLLGTEIPPSWRRISMGKVLQPRKQKDIPSTFPGLPYIGMEHVVRDMGLIDSFGSSSDYRSSAPRVYEGDVLYGRLRPYLNKVVISPCEAFASGEFITLPPNEEIMGKFLQLRLLSQDFVEFAGTLDTGDRPRVSWEQISQFELALPPIDEQIKMISILEDHLSRLDASVNLADAMEKQSFGLRRSLLQAAFTGQLINEVVRV
jgi:type I restriction enzyme S subunit